MPHTALRRAERQAPDLARVRQLVGYRDELVGLRTAMRNRRHAVTWTGDTEMLDGMDALLAPLATQLPVGEAAIRSVLATIPEREVLTAQVGVGTLTAAAVLASLPPGVHGQATAAATAAGVQPRQEQSGQGASRHRRQQGCPAVRRYLSLAAPCAVRCDPVLTAWDEALPAWGKVRQRALWAVAHTLLRQMMGRLQHARAERVAATKGADPARPLAA